MRHRPALEGLDEAHATAAARARRWLINLWFGSRCIVLDTSHYADIEQLAAKRELLGAMAICEQAVMADAMEARGTCA